MTMISPTNDFLILALDFDSFPRARDFLAKVPAIRFIKIGMELFYAEGPGIFSSIRQIRPDIRIFLDLKINDIPKTIEKAVKKISGFQPDYLTLFTGRAGIEAALIGKGNSPMRILNVTVLTSEESGETDVLRRAVLTHQAGADGVICSGMETRAIRDKIQDTNFIIVNPGIRLESGNDDQVRTVTPVQALQNGATNIVVGRPITQANDPQAAVELILKSLSPRE